MVSTMRHVVEFAIVINEKCGERSHVRHREKGHSLAWAWQVTQASWTQDFFS